MQLSELKELHDQVEQVRLRDVRLGNLLHSIVAHLGHALGVEEPAETVPTEAAKEEESGN